jgi:alginate O-acetyltransferase complex protein AlgI
MVFSSSQFFLFFSGYLFLHLIVPARQRIALIIVGSTFFYGYWNPWYVWLPYLLVAIAFFGTLWQGRARDAVARRWRVTLVVAVALAPLVVIKYTNFFYRDVLGIFIGDRGPLVPWAFPLGISFVTFTMIAYVVDVYRGKYPVERSPGLLSGLVLFFPHLIAGPILRPHDLLPQLANPQPASRGFGIRFVYGFAIFTLGLFKKTVVADTLSETVRTVYEGAGSGLNAADYLLAWYGFCAQIYCDFSGYTDMAIGAAIILGVRLPINFRQPFAATSIIDFWRRWHITLTNWLRDYIYIPLGGSRSGSVLQFRNVIVTLGLSGLWHGAHWNFVIWGLVNGIAIAFNQWLGGSKALSRTPRWLKIFVTFHFVCIAFVLFRSPDLSTAARVMTGPFLAPPGNFEGFISVHMFELMLLGAFFATHRWDSHRAVRRSVHRLPAIVVWPVMAVVWIFSISVSQDNSSKFIYFDF